MYSYIYDICIYSSMLLCLQLFLVICSGAMISKVGAEFLLPPQPIPAESHPTHRGAAVQLSEGRSANELWEFGGSGGQTPPVHWNLILTLGFGCHRKPSFGRGFGTWRCWQMLCACGGHWAPYWAHRAPSWRLAACWAHVGASLGTSCYMLGPQWHHVGRSSPNPTHLHPILAAPDRSTHCAILFVYATDALAISSLLTY